jgi:hypothetical protein
MHSRGARFFVLALLLASGMTGYYFGLLLPRVRSIRTRQQLYGAYYLGGDFYPLWLTAHELRRTRANPYTDTMTGQIQVGLFGRLLDPSRSSDPPPNYRAFSYPLFAGLLVWPLATLPFPQVRVLLLILFVPLAAFTVWIWLRALGVTLAPLATVALVLLYLTSYPMLDALVALQPTVLVAALLAAAVWALARDRYWCAGIWLALAAIKPQVTVLLTLWLVLWGLRGWRRRKGIALGFALTTVILLGASDLVLPGWPRLWINYLLAYRQYTPPPLIQLVMGRAIGAAVGVALLALAAALAWRTRRAEPQTSDFALTVSFLLAVSVVLFPSGVAVYEHVLLLPALLWLYMHRQEFLKADGPRCWLAYALVAALLWPWVTACILVIATGLVLPSFRNMIDVLVPVRMAAPLPFLVLALMGFSVVRKLANPPAVHTARYELSPEEREIHFPSKSFSALRFLAGRLCSADRSSARYTASAP